MERRSSFGLLSVLFIGIALLYVPILVLIGYSFNASPLVNVWGGFSTAWYAQLLLFVSMVQLLGWPHRGLTTIVLSHVTFCTAYVTITVQSRLQAADRSLEEAAQDLGATPARAFVEITLPIIAPAIISSWLLCFTLSLDDLVISSFVAGPGASTLPMVIYSKVKLGVSPDINALASLIVCGVGVCIVSARLLMMRSERRRALEARPRGR